MRKLLVAISVLILPLSASVSAQQTKTVPPPKPKVVSTPPKRPLLGRIFGRKDQSATPEPAAKPAEKPTEKPTEKRATTPVPRKRAKRPAPAAETEKPVSTQETPAPAATPEKPETQPPTPAKTETDPGTTPPEPKPAVTEKPVGSTKKDKKGATTSKVDISGMDEAGKYRVAKAAAQEDAAIKELQAKAESALTDPEAHAASVAYNRALFRKIRSIEPSLDGYVDRLETAMMKRLNSEKKSE